MNENILCRLIGSLALIIFLSTTLRAATIATVPVGSPGNFADSVIMNDGTGGYGAVSYSYRIGTYDVTNAQYVEFLNARASAADPHGLWNSNMDPSNFEGAISRSGSGPYNYSVKPGYANKPVVWVSWDDAVRFVNWLTNGQGNGDTETGSYNLSSFPGMPSVSQRAVWASSSSVHWVVPTENEWYKAAYYNAVNEAYYAYPFRSDSQPIALPPQGFVNTGNFNDAAKNYDGTGSGLTDVGAYPNAKSPFGSFDMGGDVFQWVDTASTVLRGTRGGGWDNSAGTSASSFHGLNSGGYNFNIGFRVVSLGGVPEPSTIGLVATGALGLFAGRKNLLIAGRKNLLRS